MVQCYLQILPYYPTTKTPLFQSVSKAGITNFSFILSSTLIFNLSLFFHTGFFFFPSSRAVNCHFVFNFFIFVENYLCLIYIDISCGRFVDACFMMAVILLILCLHLLISSLFFPSFSLRVFQIDK